MTKEAIEQALSWALGDAPGEAIEARRTLARLRDWLRSFVGQPETKLPGEGNYLQQALNDSAEEVRLLNAQLDAIEQSRKDVISMLELEQADHLIAKTKIAQYEKIVRDAFTLVDQARAALLNRSK